MKPTLTGSKDMEDNVPTPTYIVTASSEQDKSKKGGITRKHVLFVVGGVLVVALILVAILVGMYLFTQAQKEIVQFSLKFKGSDDQDVEQDVESDPNDNVVSFHVSKPGQDAYVVNDFNRNMQIVKLKTDEGLNCYVTALNKSSAMDPSAITGPDSMKDNNGKNVETTFAVSEDPVVDRSFLTKKAQDLCKGVAVYWVTRQCGKQITNSDQGLNSTDSDSGRVKRSIYYAGTYYGLPGLAGCCRATYACSVRIVEYVQGYLHTCYTYVSTGTCCGRVRYPYCLNYYQMYHRTPGLIC